MVTTSPSLLERLHQADEPAAWSRFIELYTPLLFAWAQRLGLQENDCADLVQDVLATLVEKLPVFRLTPLGSFRAWLRTILLNRWRNLQRRQPMQALPDDASPGEHGDVADVLGEQEYHRLLVARALQLLQTDFKETTWRAFWECSINGRPAEDVANELGISRGALHVARSRVLHRLREELAGLLD